MSPVVPRPSPPARRRSATVPAWVASVVTVVVVVLGSTPATAKGAFPVPPEPQGALVVGRPTPVVLRLQVPEGLDPAVLDAEPGESGPEMLWNLVAVPGRNPAPPDAGGIPAGGLLPMADLQELPLQRREPLIYTASFTPSAPGEWRLLAAVAVPGGWQSIDVERTVTVDPAPPAAVASGPGSALGPLLGVAGALAAVALGALAWRSRARAVGRERPAQLLE
jgi:hypothetical protein